MKIGYLSNQKNNATQRYSFISLSRIIGMIMIILCHIVKFYTFIPGNVYLGQIFGAGVYLFLFISGYLYGNKVISKFKTFFARKFLSITFPAILFTIVMIALNIFANTEMSINSIIAYSLDLEGLLFLNWSFFGSFFSEITNLGTLWFTTVIFLCYLLIPLLQFVTNKFGSKIKLILILSAVIGVPLSIALLNYINAGYFITFAIGYFSGNLKLLEKIRLRSLVLFTIATTIFLAGRFIMSIYLSDTYLHYLFTFLQSSTTGVFVVIILAYLSSAFQNFFQKLSEHKIIKTMDSYSYYVYLTHGVFTTVPFVVYGFTSLPISTILFISLTVISAVLLKLITDLISKPLIKKLK